LERDLGLQRVGTRAQQVRTFASYHMDTSNRDEDKQDGTCTNMTMPRKQISWIQDGRKIYVVNERTLKTFAARACLSRELTEQHRIHSDIPSGIVQPSSSTPHSPSLSRLA